MSIMSGKVKTMSKKTVYIVQEFGWEYNDEFFEIIMDTPIKAFATREQAETHKRILEREAREDWDSGGLGMSFPTFESVYNQGNPFSALTSLTRDEFSQHIHALGLPSLQFDEDDLFEENALWQAVRKLPKDKYHAFFDLLDGVNFCEIVEMEVEE
jgi:hypothetical protein